MIYDDVSKKWNPSGSSPGVAKVQIYQHLLNQTYRVVGRKIQDHEVVINCLLSKGLKYNQANQTFLQWRDSKQVYGLHFQSKEEADLFSQTMKLAVDNLNRLAGVSSNSTSTSSSTSSGININGNNADNISLGKRSISSDYNQSIYDENENRQAFNLMNGNTNGIHHNNSSNGLYNGNQNGVRLQQQQQSQVTSPPLSTSSSSSSSSSSNGLVNGTNGYPQNLAHHRQSSDYNNANGNNQYYMQQQQQQQSVMQQQLQQNVHQNMYQSSPIPPPPPPPPPGSLFSVSQSYNGGNSQNSDNYSQKIYDVIPDSNSYTPSQNNMVQNVIICFVYLFFLFIFCYGGQN